MNVGCVPVNECVVQLELQDKIAQTSLSEGARVLGTIGAGFENAQGVGGASIHGACGRW